MTPAAPEPEAPEAPEALAVAFAHFDEVLAGLDTLSVSDELLALAEAAVQASARTAAEDPGAWAARLAGQAARSAD